jgi:DNA-directed DNA polymerase III PolC
MTALHRVYEYGKKQGIKTIAGIKIYFKDENCELSKWSKAKYFTLTLYASNQENFQKMSALASKERKTAESYGMECPLWTWDDLKVASEAGLYAVSADIHDMVTKHLITGNPKLAEPMMLKLKELFGDRYSVAVVGTSVTHSWMPVTEIVFWSGKSLHLLGSERTMVSYQAKDEAKNIKVNASEINAKRHIDLVSYIRNGVVTKVNQKIVDVRNHTGFFRVSPDDLQFRANRVLMALASRHSIKILYSDHACYAEPEDKFVQDIRLLQDGFKEHSKRHMQGREEALEQLKRLGLGEEILDNNSEWASRLEFAPKYDYQLPTSEGSAYEKIIRIIKEKGRLPMDDRYVSQLRYELEVLSKNGTIDLLPYFLPIVDVIEHYQSHGVLTSVGRGSAAGCLISYLIGITEVDPIKYGLSFDRFISLDRVLAKTMPDIDTDLPSRDLLVGEDGKSGYLFNRYGDRAAQISTRTLLRLKSAIKDVARAFHGEVDGYIENLTKALPSAPQGISDDEFVFGYKDPEGNDIEGLISINEDFKLYIKNHPAEWEIVKRALSISRTFSKHASAFVIADRPISETTPVFMGNVTQYDAKSVEKTGLIKYDFLVVKQLEDIQGCLSLINKKNRAENGAGWFDHRGVKTYIWNLPEDKGVFESVWGGETETVFQINTSTMQPFVREIKPQSIEDLSAILALVRPGTMDAIDEVTQRTMAEEYVERRYGRSASSIPELQALVPETYGVLLYQEQCTRIFKELAGMTPTDSEKLRRALNKKLKSEVLSWKKTFMDGARKKVSPEIAQQIWDQIEAGSRYNFNKSHAVSYAFITYACMFLKHHYPLEWWASVLTNATEAEISQKLYKHVRNFLDAPDINLSTERMEIDYERQRIVSKLSVLRGMGEALIEPIVRHRPYADIEDLVRKRVIGDSIAKKLIHAGVMDSLFPVGTPFLTKMQMYADAVEKVKYEEKVAEGKNPKPPKKGTIDIEYLNLHPINAIKRKKEILPTMPISITQVFLDCTSLSSRVEESLRKGRQNPLFMNCGPDDKPEYRLKSKNGSYFNYILLHGNDVRIMEDETTEHLGELEKEETTYFCAVGYVVKSEEKAYDKGRKKRLILNLDFDGYLTEKVLWPDYNDGTLSYPSGLKKGSVAMFYMRRKHLAKQTQIFGIELIEI